MRRFVWLIVASCPLPAMGQVPAPRSDPGFDTLAGLRAEADEAQDSFLEKGRSMKPGTGERAVVVEAYRAHVLSLMDRALTLARSHPGESECIEAPTWVARETVIGRVVASIERYDDVEVDKRGDAAYRLLADAAELDDTAIGEAIFAATGEGHHCPESERFLRAVISRSRNRTNNFLARATLGGNLAEMARLHDRLAAPISGPELTRGLTQVCLDRCRAVDGPRLRSEAEALMEGIVREYGDEPESFGGQVAGELFRLRHLRIGQPTPELVGEDLDGAPIRLGDFRGKVVLLSFWATSNDSSMDLVRRQKELLAAMKGRPFAPVGVNGDAAEDRAKVKEAVAKEGIVWRSFWAGGPDGPIPRRWGVERWPTTYLIDAKGIIRDDQVGDKLTPAALEPLVQGDEDAAR